MMSKKLCAVYWSANAVQPHINPDSAVPEGEDGDFEKEIIYSME